MYRRYSKTGSKQMCHRSDGLVFSKKQNQITTLQETRLFSLAVGVET
jgi:hypothetical protein